MHVVKLLCTLMVYCSRRVCSAMNWIPCMASQTSGQVISGFIKQWSAEHAAAGGAISSCRGWKDRPCGKGSNPSGVRRSSSAAMAAAAADELPLPPCNWHGPLNMSTELPVMSLMKNDDNRQDKKKKKDQRKNKRKRRNILSFPSNISTHTCVNDGKPKENFKRQTCCCKNCHPCQNVTKTCSKYQRKNQTLNLWLNGSFVDCFVATSKCHPSRFHCCNSIGKVTSSSVDQNCNFIRFVFVNEFIKNLLSKRWENLALLCKVCRLLESIFF